MRLRTLDLPGEQGFVIVLDRLTPEDAAKVDRAMITEQSGAKGVLVFPREVELPETYVPENPQGDH